MPLFYRSPKDYIRDTDVGHGKTPTPRDGSEPSTGSEAMATDDKIMTAVKKELKKNPDIQVKDLYEKLSGKVEGVEELSLRQFNARYPLQIKRRERMAEAESQAAPARASQQQRRRRSRRRDEASRGEVRDVFLRFASELSSAEERSELVGVLSKVDGYVDEVVKAARK